jgi:HEPN domain-containing protein
MPVIQTLWTERSVDEDLRQVVNNLQGPLPSPAGAAYHCQQAAEKLVKAALVKPGLAFPKTHDIAALVGLLPAQHRLKDKFRSFEKLTPFGVAYRYPLKMNGKSRLPKQSRRGEKKSRLSARCFDLLPQPSRAIAVKAWAKASREPARPVSLKMSAVSDCTEASSIRTPLLVRKVRAAATASSIAPPAL